MQIVDNKNYLDVFISESLLNCNVSINSTLNIFDKIFNILIFIVQNYS